MELPPAKGILAALVLLSVGYYFVSVLFSPLRKIPGPPAARFTKLWYVWRVALGQFHYENTALHRKYGPLVRVTPNHVSCNDPNAVKTVYGFASNFPKSDWYQALRAPGSFTMFTDQDIKRHAETRKVFQHLYSLSSVVAYEPFVDQCIDMFMDRLGEMAEEGKTVEAAHWFQAFAFDVIGCITYSAPFGFLERGEDINDLMYLLHVTMQWSSFSGMFPWLFSLLFYPTAKLGMLGSKGRLVLIDIVQNRMARRADERKLGDPEKPSLKSQEEGRPKDFLDRLFARHVENPEKVTKLHVFLNGLSNITAGSDTTASTLSGLVHLLLSNPRVLTKLRQEVREKSANGELSERPTFKECQQMPYLDAVLKESLRLHSAVGLPLWRVVPKGGVEIAGQFLPAGTTVGLNAWVAHRNAEVWGSDCEEFRPERWLEAQAEAEAGNRERLQRMEAYYLPFGLGSRTCIGRHISILEIKKLMPRLLRDFDMELNRPDDKLQADAWWFVLPKNFMMRFKKRAKQDGST